MPAKGYALYVPQLGRHRHLAFNGPASDQLEAVNSYSRLGYRSYTRRPIRIGGVSRPGPRSLSIDNPIQTFGFRHAPSGSHARLLPVQSPALDLPAVNNHTLHSSTAISTAGEVHRGDCISFWSQVNQKKASTPPATGKNMVPFHIFAK